MTNYRSSHNQHYTRARVVHPDSPAGRHFDWASLRIPHPDSPAGRHFDWSSLDIAHPRSAAARRSCEWGMQLDRILQARCSKEDMWDVRQSKEASRRGGRILVREDSEAVPLDIRLARTARSPSRFASPTHSIDPTPYGLLHYVDPAEGSDELDTANDSESSCELSPAGAASKGLDSANALLSAGDQVVGSDISRVSGLGIAAPFFDFGSQVSALYDQGDLTTESITKAWMNTDLKVAIDGLIPELGAYDAVAGVVNLIGGHPILPTVDPSKALTSLIEGDPGNPNASSQSLIPPSGGVDQDFVGPSGGFGPPTPADSSGA